MSNIVKINQLNKLKKSDQIVLVGGCFDILHLGHISFLKEARKLGKTLVILLESDATIKKIKGQSRPINNQQNRAEMLINLDMVDWVILLPEINGQQYTDLIKNIKPSVIAITKGDEKTEIKKTQAKLVEAKLVEVIKRIPSYSTSQIIEVMNEI